MIGSVQPARTKSETAQPPESYVVYNGFFRYGNRRQIWPSSHRLSRSGPRYGQPRRRSSNRPVSIGNDLCTLKPVSAFIYQIPPPNPYNDLKCQYFDLVLRFLTCSCLSTLHSGFRRFADFTPFSSDVSLSLCSDSFETCAQSMSHPGWSPACIN